MPCKPLRICNKVGCPELTKDKYCEAHQPEEKKMKAEKDKRYEETKRDQKSKQFYNSKEWIAVREVVRRRDRNLCVKCLENNVIKAADICDHIVPIRTDWSLRLSSENCQMLCHLHHNQKTQQDKIKYSLS